jgi:hypothetical protein
MMGRAPAPGILRRPAGRLTKGTTGGGALIFGSRSFMRPSRMALLATAVAAFGALALAPAASSASPRQQLADRYAPIIALAVQKAPCKDGEPWRPVPVSIVLGNREVVLRSPAKHHPIVKRAPTGADLYDKGQGYYLDFPGDPLYPRCRYDRDGKRYAARKPSVAFARIVSQRDDAGELGRLALQYWFFYYFNNFNDKHEADWEGIQIVFPVGTVGGALLTEPDTVAYSQHEGGERADWDSDKVDKVDTHPVVYSAVGSHASYFSESLWLGASATEGVGCDDTRGPMLQKRLKAFVIPSTVHSAHAPYAWIAFEGRWGQKLPGANNGPTGPNMKPRWAAPFEWEDEARVASFALPTGATLGESVTGAFCAVVRQGSNLLNFYYWSPPIAGATIGLVVLLLIALVVWLLRRTNWSPVNLAPIRARRDCGQILRASFRMYRQRMPLFLGLGLFSVVVAIVVALVEALITGSPPHLSGVGIGYAAFLSELVVGAAIAVALDRLDRGQSVNVLHTWWAVIRRLPWLLVAVVLVWVFMLILVRVSLDSVPSLLDDIAGVDELSDAATAFGIVVLVGVIIWWFAGWLFLSQLIYIDRCGPFAALVRGPKLVRVSWGRSLILLTLISIIGIASGPIVGFIVLFTTHVGPDLLNLVGSAVYVLIRPALGIATTLLFFDLEARQAETVEAPARVGEVVSA